ncbi:MAG: formylglycine-generating enzyme family protein [Burkholderiales bacterium]
MLSAAPSHAFDEIKDCGVCPELVVVPAGQFMMGSNSNESSLPDEKPAHLVKIAKSFAVGKYEVTFDNWHACVSGGGCRQADDEGWGRGNRPVINVDHAAAKAYASWLSRKTGKRYRLLSESEWEYAARGGTVTAWYWGSIEEGIGIPAGCLYANTHDQSSKTNRPDYAWLAHPCEDGYTYTAPAGTFKPNPFGLYDMLGNVAEWVEDCEASYKDAPADGSAAVANDCEARVTRGGAWMHGPTWVRSAFRHPQTPGYANYTVGLRIARDLP